MIPPILWTLPEKAVLSGVTEGKIVNEVTINGAPANHLTLFQPPGLELELWLTKDARSLPERLFITYRSVPGQPNFIATFSDWNFSVTPTDADFTFQPPEGAKQVALKPAAAPPPAKRKERRNEKTDMRLPGERAGTFGDTGRSCLAWRRRRRWRLSRRIRRKGGPRAGR